MSEELASTGNERMLKVRAGGRSSVLDAVAKLCCTPFGTPAASAAVSMVAKCEAVAGMDRAFCFAQAARD